MDKQMLFYFRTDDRSFALGYPLSKKFILLIILFFLLAACSLPYTKQAKVKGVYHRVKPGENLYQISNAYSIGLQELAEVNNITDPNVIKVGSVLFIPDANQIIDDIMTSAKLADISAGTLKVEQKNVPPSQKEAVRDPDRTSPVLSARDKGQAAEEKIRISMPSSTLKEEDIIKKPVSAGPRPVIKDNRPDKKSTASDKDQTKIATAVKEWPKATAPVTERGTGIKTVIEPEPPPMEKKEKEPENKIVAIRTEDSAKQTHEWPVSSSLQFDKKRFIWPLQGKVISRFGIQPNGMYLNGIKIAAKEGSTIMAAAAGTVIFSAPLKGYGETIIIKHEDNFATVYTHLNNRMVSVESKVRKGDKIALLGRFEKEGDAYLNFEIRQNNKARNPLFFLP